MDVTVKAPNNNICAAISLPASKSISNRVAILNALSPAPQPLYNLSDSDDTAVMLDALRTDCETVDLRAAGTAMRFLTAYFASRPGRRTLTGTDRMRNRPIRVLVDALRMLGAKIDYLEKEGYPPLRITGRDLNGGEVTLDGGVSSQYVSALLMIAPATTRGIRLHLTGTLISEPYLRLTVALMRQFGVAVEEEGQTFTVRPQTVRPIPFTVESDWSAASYWYEIAALSQTPVEIELIGLLPDSLQGDSAIALLFRSFGVHTDFTSEERVRLTRRAVSLPSRFDYDCVRIPDMAQTLAVTCAILRIPFRLSGLQSLRIKETDRLKALQTELGKLGVVLTEHDGKILEWDGSRCQAEPEPVIATYDDHRMAMAFAPVALCREEGIRIANPEVVSKSYPRFWDDLQTAGFQITS
ncbi:3-phosphoshikimate 1-carboxyvinyltransferase [Tannerella forsythia]|uniref:3-phosphoshikimate 1-carboxyvinyltransferase n=1 Tax=Tannerella forsythia TaxID=28112 RepID=A0A3P1YU85_TANFO|nr:3-phosphoshikimate 1-carboxyvinyltransferase [Tannerella forsythia]RRD73306.1 3-phosphoshikimate 1-carboxyvinyltransferase [Tannerella forsythia]